MDKQDMLYLYSTVVYNHKKVCITDMYYSMGGPWKYYAKWKKPKKPHKEAM